MIELYLISILDNIQTCACIALFISAFAILICTIIWAIHSGSYSNDTDVISTTRKLAYKFLWVFIPALFFSLVTPSSKQGYMILGMGTVIDYMQNSEEIQQLPDKAVQALNLFIDEYLEESSKNTTNK